MAASIIINQAGKPVGLPSVSRDDLAIGITVVLTNYDNTGVTTWTWEMLSRPVGSSATISGSSLPTASFVPDVTGSYLIKLTLDEDPATDTRIGAVKTSFLSIRKPATSERKEFDSLDGWSAAQQAMIDSIDTDASLNLKRNGTNQPTSDINWGTRKITNLGGLDNEGALRLGEITDPTLVSDKGFVYAKDDGGDTELFWMDDSGAVVQITKDGNLDVSVLQGDTLPAKTGDGFLKRNTGNTGWEETPYGVSANTVCEGNDSRLSDARTPLPHALTHLTTDPIDIASIDSYGLCPRMDGYATHFLNGTGLWVEPSGSGGVPSSRQINTANGLAGGGDLSADRTLIPVYGHDPDTICEGDDARLSDNRYPTAHQSSHVSGSDQIPVASITSKGFCPQFDGYSTHFLNGDGYFTTPAGGGGGAPWVTALDLDFTTEANQTLSSDTTYTIGGLSWTKINSANDNVAMAVVNGTGLVVQPKQNTNLTNGDRSLPAITCPIYSIIPDFDTFTNIRVTAYFSDGNWTANYDGTVLAIENPTTRTHWSSMKLYFTQLGAFGRSIWNNGSAVTTGAVQTGAARNVHQLAVPGISSGRVMAATGVYGADWPAQSAMRPYGAGLWDLNAKFSPLYVGTTPVPGDAADWVILLGGLRAGSLTPLSVTIARLKVEYQPSESADFVPTSRNINTTNGITGGGNLGADLTLSPVYNSIAGTCCEGNDVRLSNDRTASGLRTASTVVSVSSAAAPSANKLLTASDSVTAIWKDLPSITDPPPASPSVYDDEFDGYSSAIWSWIRAGVPSSTSGIFSEAQGIANSKRWAKVINDAGGAYHTVVHQLVQTSPTGDFTLFTKVIATPQIQYCNFGLIIDDGSDNNLTSWYLGVSTGGWSTSGLQRVGGTYTYNLNIHAYNSTEVYLKVVYSESGASFYFYYSPDNVVWLLAGRQTGLLWQPSRIGISWLANNNTAGEYGASFEFFRVTEP